MLLSRMTQPVSFTLTIIVVRIVFQCRLGFTRLIDKVCHVVLLFKYLYECTLHNKQFM